MNLWFVLLSLLFIFVAPAVYLFADVLSSSHEVTITATVPSLESESESESSSSSSSGGGGPWGSQTTQSQDDDDDADFPDTGSDSDEVNVDEDTAAQSGEEEEEDEDEESEDTEEVAEPTSTDVYFGGYSFPDAIINYSLNGETVSTVQADASGYFEGSYSLVEAGDQIFSFQAEIYEGDVSQVLAYGYTVQAGSPVYISGITLPPILDISSGGELEGVSIPGSEILIYGIDSNDQSLHVVSTIQVKPDGTYAIEFDLGETTVYDQYYAACEWKGLDCGFSGIIEVQMVGNFYKFVDKIPADFNEDIRVDFVDFAFLRAAFLSGNNNPLYDLNQDGVINLLDFSLLDYQWSL